MVEIPRADAPRSTPTFDSVWAMGLEAFEDEALTRSFFNSPHPMLGGKSPFEILQSGDGMASRVEAVLGRLIHGCAA